MIYRCYVRIKKIGRLSGLAIARRITDHYHPCIWRLFHLWLRFITFGGRPAHLAYRVHKSGRKTSIITIIITIIIIIQIKKTSMIELKQSLAVKVYCTIVYLSYKICRDYILFAWYTSNIYVSTELTKIKEDVKGLGFVVRGKWQWPSSGYFGSIFPYRSSPCQCSGGGDLNSLSIKEPSLEITAYAFMCYPCFMINNYICYYISYLLF